MANPVRSSSLFPWGRCLVILSLVVCTATAQAGEALLRAFPTAEGFGACTPGGRGGAIICVTTLEDYLPGEEKPVEGSLRAAVDTEGSRIVLFRVGGTIALKKDLWIRNPYITIAGQTAPGGGICVRDYQVVLATHDIIIRHMRFRAGDVTRKEQMSIGIFGGHDSILDHCSMTWAIDEVMSSFGTVHNLTVQWCIVSEGLSHSYHPKGEHSKGSILNGDGGVSIHHCAYAHNSARNPRVDTVVLDWRNNVLYNWGYRAGYTREGPAYVNYVGNYLKPGPSTRRSARTNVFGPGDDMARIHCSDNVLVGFPEETRDNTLLIRVPKGHDSDTFRTHVTVSEPFPCPLVETTASETALGRVLAECGATLPKRDSTDARLMEEIRTGTGRIIDSQAEVGGWPALERAPTKPDTDEDGMPDSWEDRYRFDPADPSDGRGDADDDGYTNIEEFLNATDPHTPESRCRVDADAFRGLQQTALDRCAEGRALLAERKRAADADWLACKATILDSMEVTLTPSDDPNASRMMVDLGGVDLELVLIPAGTFLMGSPESEGGLDIERPQHQVTISRPFYMAATPTTNMQIKALFGPEARNRSPEEDSWSAHEVSWFEAVEYCEMLTALTGRTFRLPTEAEWEYACRAGTTTAFNAGDTITTDQANFDGAEATRFNPAGATRGKKAPVRSYPPNAWGLYDMHGNDAEYCQDVCFRRYTPEPVVDPVSSGETGARVMRGGKAGSKAFYIRSAYRYGYAPAVGYTFRVVMECEP